MERVWQQDSLVQRAGVGSVRGFRPFLGALLLVANSCNSACPQADFERRVSVPDTYSSATLLQVPGSDGGSAFVSARIELSRDTAVVSGENVHGVPFEWHFARGAESGEY